jgi:hypothetical protein
VPTRISLNLAEDRILAEELRREGHRELVRTIRDSEG